MKNNRISWLIIAILSILLITGYTSEGFANEMLVPVGILRYLKISDHPSSGEVNGLFSKIINAKSGTVIFDGVNATTVSQYTTTDHYIFIFTDASLKTMRYSTTPLSLADAATFNTSTLKDMPNPITQSPIQNIGVVFTNSSGAYVNYNNIPIATTVTPFIKSDATVMTTPVIIAIVSGVLVLLIGGLYLIFGRSSNKNSSTGEGNF